LQLAIPYNLALLPTVFFPISVAYALLKYRLFELGHALKFALSRVALLAVMILLYGVVALAVAPLAGESVRDPLVMTFFSLLIVMLFNPLLRRFESVIDRFIYRQDYDPAAVQSQVSLFLRSLAAPPALAKGFLERIVDPLGIKTASVLFREKDAPRWLSVLSDGQVLLENGDGISLSRLWEGKDYAAICRAEVALDPRFEGKQNEILLLCERSKAEIMLPLVFENELRGVISLGVKRAGREYSANDFRLLGTLAEQLTLSLENGRLYQESEAAREKAEASNRKLIEMDRVKKDFVANICHEIRTPVSTIIGFAEILRDPGYQGESRAILDRLVNNGQELSGLMDNLMNYSRMEADGSASRCETVNLKELFTGLAIVTGRLIRGRPIEFGAHVETTFAAIESDAQKLQQILVELLTNAVKFTKQGRVELTARDGGEPGLLEFAVADTGIGIRCEDQKLIFEDFRQLDGSSTRQYGGTGVGLGLCKKFAASLGGEIQVASELGIGSVFKLILPASAAHSAAVRRAA
jgi:signal transduction histidine kinase